MANGYPTEMTFIKTANNGNQLVFEDVDGCRYKMSHRHFLENMSPRNKVIYTRAGGLPFVGQAYSVYLYSDSGNIALDKSVYLWEPRDASDFSYSYKGSGFSRGKKKNYDIGKTSTDFACALISLCREIYHGLKNK